ACGTSPVVKNAAPSIKESLKERPPERQLQIVTSDPVAPDPDKAMENYRKLLELDPDERTRAESMRRMADLGVQTDDLKGGNEDSAKTLGKSIAIYEQLLIERPGNVNNDRVLYQLARAHQN